MNERGSGGGTKSRKGGNKRKPFHPNYDYEVDYNDHFETPLQAYQDILPILDFVGPKSSQNSKDFRKQHIIYDPYYCNGRTKSLLQSLGFDQVVHEKRDFYKDIASGQVPKHHTLVTNPPYSDDHKEKCLQFCIDQFRASRKCFFLLIPNYVAARNYYKRILGDNMKDVAYLAPTKEYSYSHPEGTGHEESPFASLWFCCIGREKIQKLARSWTQSTKFIASFDELVALGVISLQNRPNPRQRKKMRKLAAQMQDGSAGMTHNKKSSKKSTTTNQSSSKMPKEQPKKKKRSNSKYRNNKTGERTKKRF